MYDEVELDEGGVGKMQAGFSRTWQIWMDKAAPHTAPRWAATVFIMLAYCLRVYLINGWYIITYGLGIYALNLLIGFLSPATDPETEGPTLPTSKDDEFRPFVRRLPEFKFWRAFCVAFCMTFFSLFNIPVFWPILLMYFFALFFLTMKRQIKHMIKYKYVPFSFGKAKYKGKEGEGGSRSAE
ncbi:hypothetical protein EMIHUDRAFT_70641 [Emiliania huxleyi CCMP1516]|uniref:Protein RER1 n=2 Tax=Emiliania huxleyi TaxID=2903 RepID=A0A0D3KLP2_EMIH1|nr:hypothetical protein EMIHUDRAFT_70641 [Emiliania huxleyi CCMP1516]EOD36677.1 hypothetical protein EMIHUDRAFT_70641 [Emiliania huxleyi CCMP1516]|eukprot:XP_005789106.1 hypothetical protein EMIHUDRAFT_70641 [Emiliania huxleyi CCMP1516]